MSVEVKSFGMSLPALEASGRGADPDYSTLSDSEDDGLGAIEDLQTTAALNSTAEITNAVQRSPLWTLFVQAKSLGAGCMCAPYAVLPDLTERAIVTAQAVTRTTGYELVEFPTFQLDQFEKLYVRIWGPAGGRINEVSMVIRPDEYDAVDVECDAGDIVIGPDGPVVYQEGGELVEDWNFDEDNSTAVPAPYVVFPGIAHDEKVQPLLVGHRDGELDHSNLGPPHFWNPHQMAVVQNTVVIDTGFTISASNSDDERYDVEGKVPASTYAGVAGDVFETWLAGGGDSYFVGPTEFWAKTRFLSSKAILAKSLETADAECSDSEASRTVGFSHPRPGAIDHWEARVYDYDSMTATYTLRTVVDADVDASETPFTFPPLPAGDYILFMRAVYYDGSWTDDGCFHTPTDNDVVFRHQFKSGEAAAPAAAATVGGDADTIVFTQTPSWKGV